MHLASLRSSIAELKEELRIREAQLEEEIPQAFASAVKDAELHKRQLETMDVSVQSMSESCNRLMRSISAPSSAVMDSKIVRSRLDSM
jgi:hypothetical protein